MIHLQIKRHEEPVTHFQSQNTGQNQWDKIRNMPEEEFKKLLAKGRSLYRPGDEVALKTSNGRSIVKITGFEEDKTRLLNYQGHACFIYAYSLQHGKPDNAVLYALEELDWDSLVPAKEEPSTLLLPEINCQC